MARKMSTSRSQLDRVLDPDNVLCQMGEISTRLAQRMQDLILVDRMGVVELGDCIRDRLVRHIVDPSPQWMLDAGFQRLPV